MFGSKIENVMVEKLNLNLECYLDFLNGKGIKIDSVESYDKNNDKILHGLQSEFFGTDFGDDYAFQERYSCKCKKYIGKMYEGEICDVCGTSVEYSDTDLTKTGWIILSSFSVISPIYYAKLTDALGSSGGEKVLGKIINVEVLDEESVECMEKFNMEKKKHPFINKGTIWLKEHLWEVLDYYEKKKPSKVKLFKELKEDIGLIFTSCIPVYSSLLRTELPGITGHKLYKLKINTSYQSVIRIANFVNSISDYSPEMLMSIDIQLAAIQKELTDIFTEVYKELTGKKGIILSKVMGGRYNFAARNIIVSSSGRLRADEIEVGYVVFMELFRYEIINFYSKIQNCTIVEASNVWKKGLTHFNPTLYNIMQHMTTDKKCSKYLNVIINRNPSIDYGSFMFMRIVKVKPNIDDKTLTIPSNCLKPMNADFDGDILNIFRIFGSHFAKEFSKNMNPRYNLYIDKMNGRVNPDTMPIKDEVIAFYTFNNI